MYQLLLYEPSKNPIVKIETERTIINEATKMQLLTFQSQNRTVPLQLFCLYCKIHEPASIILGKVNSVQEARAKCFTVHILKFEILQIT